MVGSALAESARLGRSETLHPPERTLCLSQKRRPAAERNGNASPTIGTPVVETACDAAELALPRSVAVADRRGEERSGPCLWFRHDSFAQSGSSGHTHQLSFPTR